MMWFLSPPPPSLNPTELGWVVFFIAIFLLSCGPLIQLLPADRQTDRRTDQPRQPPGVFGMPRVRLSTSVHILGRLTTYLYLSIYLGHRRTKPKTRAQSENENKKARI